MNGSEHKTSNPVVALALMLMMLGAIVFFVPRLVIYFEERKAEQRVNAMIQNLREQIWAREEAEARNEKPVPRCVEGAVAMMDGMELSHHPSSASFSVTMQEGPCRAEATSEVPWIKVSARNGYVALMVEKNEGGARTAIIRASGRNFVVTQRSASDEKKEAPKKTTAPGGSQAKWEGHYNPQKDPQPQKGVC